MSESVVRVDLRQATLSENARLREAGDLLFLALENPPPVRCLLRLISDDEVKAFEVARVIEVVDEGEPARGCYGRHVDLERLEEQAKVGSEHLEAGITGGGGIPAPVVIMNTAEMMLGEAGEDAEALAAGDSGEGDSGEGDSGDSESSEGDSGEGDPSEGDSDEASEGDSGEGDSGDSESSESESDSGEDQPE